MSDVMIDLRCFGVTGATETPNTFALHIVQKAKRAVNILHVNPFTGTFQHKTSLILPVTTDGTINLIPASLSPPRTKIIGIFVLLERDPRNEWIYLLWAILEDGGYGYWNLMEAAPEFQQQGFCSKNDEISSGQSSAQIDHTGSIVVNARIQDETLKYTCITRYDDIVQASGSDYDFEYRFGKLFSHKPNIISHSPFVNSEGTQRLLMTEMFRGFTILEYNVSGDAGETYFHKADLEREGFDCLWERALEKRRKFESDEWHGERDMERLARKFHKNLLLHEKQQRALSIARQVDGDLTYMYVSEDESET
ncbi:hypothetical protein AA313_de0210355 [Arthrobotrys entomopaga]|nr:hypothetical protein AA313_de0210355 [Arthrobotrys entomopaga]